MKGRGNVRVMCAYALLLTFIVFATIPVEGLMPACPRNRRTLDACQTLVDGPHGIEQNSTCCEAVESFLFPGCLCLALRTTVPYFQTSELPVKSNITRTVHLLWEKCVTTLPADFVCLPWE